MKITKKQIERMVENAIQRKLSEKETSRNKEYRDFFNKSLEKFGVESPDELDDNKKKEFFNYVDRNWKSLSESRIPRKKHFLAEQFDRLRGKTTIFENPVYIGAPGADDEYEDYIGAPGGVEQPGDPDSIRPGDEDEYEESVELNGSSFYFQLVWEEDKNKNTLFVDGREVGHITYKDGEGRTGTVINIDIEELTEYLSDLLWPKDGTDPDRVIYKGPFPDSPNFLMLRDEDVPNPENKLYVNGNIGIIWYDDFNVTDFWIDRREIFDYIVQIIQEENGIWGFNH